MDDVFHMDIAARAAEKVMPFIIGMQTDFVCVTPLSHGGVAGGTASGKTSVCSKIVDAFRSDGQRVVVCGLPHLSDERLHCGV